MTTKAITIFSRLENIEKELQRLKLEVFLTLPKAKQKALYPEGRLRDAVRSSRRSIWREYYAKKI